MRHPTFTFAAALFAALAAVWSAAAAPEGARWGRNWFPNHEVTAHTGETFRFYDELIEDKIVLVNFIYTRCDDVCPLQTARLKLIADQLGDRVGEDIFIYSITIEPEVDTPAVLASLADAFEVGPGWLFLTGAPEDIAEIRYKLGERSRNFSEHRNDLMVGNDVYGRWTRSSLFAEPSRIAAEVQHLDPAWRRKRRDLRGNKAAEISADFAHQRGAALFAKACAACHSIGEGDRLGPDLAGVEARRDRDWLLEFIQKPDEMRRSGDETALALDAAFPVVKMPSIGLSTTDAEDLLAYIAKREAARDVETASAEDPAAAAPATAASKSAAPAK